MRGYGDAALFVDTARSLLLGDEQTLRLPDDAPAEFPTWLEDWAVKERLTQKLLEGEEPAHAARHRPRVLLPRPRRCRVGRQGVPHDRARRVGVEGRSRPSVDPPPDMDPRPLEVPVATAYGETRHTTCWSRPVDYDASDLDGRDVYSFDLTKSEHRPLLTVDSNEDGWVNLDIDFIPVVHVPNDPSTQRTFRRSLLLRISMLLDDRSGNEADLVAAAQNTNHAVVTTGVGAGGVQSSGTPVGRPSP